MAEPSARLSRLNFRPCILAESPSCVAASEAFRTRRPPTRVTPGRVPIASFNGLGELALSLLEKTPEARPKSAAEVVAALDRILAQPIVSSNTGKAPRLDDAATFVSSPTPRLPSSKPPWTGPAKASAPKTNRAAIAWAVGLVVLFALVAVGASLSRTPAESPSPGLAQAATAPAESPAPEEAETGGKIRPRPAPLLRS